MKFSSIILSAVVLLAGTTVMSYSNLTSQQQEQIKPAIPLADTGESPEGTDTFIKAVPELITEIPVQPEVPVQPAEDITAPTPPAPEPVPLPKGSLLPGEDAYAWINRMQAEYGVYAYPGTQFFVAPSTPCTFQADILGCTEQWMNMDGTPTHTRIRLHMTEAAIGNLYVLFHEIGHTHGIMDECQADIFSRNVTGIPGGFYC